jgi:tRNA-splicing ligase RtcB
MYFNQSTKVIDKLLNDISSLKEYKSHITLPDLHYKPQMEAPSSIAISTGDYIIPSLASAAINDGMSIIKLPFKKEELTKEIIIDFFAEINSHAAKTKFDMNKYSLTQDELQDVCLKGAKAVINKFDLPADILDSMELNGVMNEDLTKEDIDRLVPKALLKSRFSRAEFGLNFRGNHFLEIQSVDKIKDTEYMKQYDIQKDDLTIMTHLGPGPFTGNLMRIYTNREKIPPVHRIMYFLSKIYFHFFEGKRSDLTYSNILKYFFNPDKYQAYNIHSNIGKDFYKLIQIGTNYGYAYQLGTFTAVRDAVRVIQKKYSLSRGDAKLIWNLSHNSIYRDIIDGEEQFIVRHNSVKIYDNKPTILAGSYDVPSCIGICCESDKNNLMNTHDHGIGSIINRLKDEKNIDFTEEVSRRYFFERGTDRIVQIKEAYISDSKPIEAIAEYFEKENIFRPWFYVKPIATLKN